MKTEPNNELESKLEKHLALPDKDPVFPAEKEAEMFDFIASKADEIQRRRLIRFPSTARMLAKAAAVMMVAGLSAWFWMHSTKQQGLQTASADPTDINRDGQVDVIDAYMFAVELESGSALSRERDVNQDGKINRMDVDFITAKAVQLEESQMKKTIAYLTLLGLLSPLSGFTSSVRFEPYDVFIDTGDGDLTAWQIELQYNHGNIAIVGLEGGETKPFPANRPPRYDSRGLQSGRIILADFTTQKDDLPDGRFRIARLHLQITGNVEPDFQIKLLAAAKPGGERINAQLSVQRMKED